jgi:hypothetical protein
MSAVFDSTKSSTLELGSAVVTAAPLTMALRYVQTANTGGRAMGLSNHTSASDWYLMGNPPTAELQVFDAGANKTATSGLTKRYKWSSSVGIASSITSAQSVTDGVVGAVFATSVNPSGLDRTNIGGRYASGSLAYISAMMADVAIWNVALTIQEALAYCAGTSPRWIRPRNLVAFFPFDNDLLDHCPAPNVYANTAVSLSAYNPPKLVLPSLRSEFPWVTAAGGGFVAVNRRTFGPRVGSRNSY